MRDKYNHKNIKESKRLNREIRVKIKQAKEDWLTEKRNDIDYFNLYKKLKNSYNHIKR